MTCPRTGRLALALLTALATTGCWGGADDGPTRYSISGTVTHDEKPVPIGFIQFYPDGEQGNKGPGTGAEIRDGAYSTPSGKGVVGGPHVVEITGYDGKPVTVEGEGTLEKGTPLFPLYKTTLDLPKESGTQNFTVE
jgi:hypothetical protein